MNKFIEQAKEKAKARGMDLRSRNAQHYITREVARLERVAATKRAASKPVSKLTKAPKEAIGESLSCLCGCGGTTAPGRMFLQGHDARLKSRILNGQRVPAEGLRYAQTYWPEIVDRAGSRKVG